MWHQFCLLTVLYVCHCCDGVYTRHFEADIKVKGSLYSRSEWYQFFFLRQFHTSDRSRYANRRSSTYGYLVCPKLPL